LTEPSSRSRVAPVPRLYAIADEEAYAPRRLEDVVCELALAGVGWIQLRAKNLADAELFRTVERTVRRLEGAAAHLWIDDRVDVAACFGPAVAGVHLGQSDLPADAARRVLGAGPWIGSSTHDRDQAREADSDSSIDIVAIGPIFATRSKRRPDPVVGLELVRTVRPLVGKPLVAIGGIDARSARAVLDAGADSVAVIAALARAPSLPAAARELLASVGDVEGPEPGAG
jgi:thiamine-phosphate pyrophosphorylase